MILSNKEQKIYDEIDEIVTKNYDDKIALKNRLYEYVNKKINSPKIDIKVDFEELFNEMNNWEEELKAVRKGLSKVSVKRNKWKNRYYKEKRKNKQLKEVIKEVREYINSKVISNGEIIDQLRKIEVKELLQILDKAKKGE